MVVVGMQAVPDLLDFMSHGIDPLGRLMSQMSFDWLVLAQQLDVDILADIQNWWNNFIRSGQIWALFIGFVLGYLFKGITSY